MLRGNDGRWHPLKVTGQLAYSIAKPELLVDLLEREQIQETQGFEVELTRRVMETASNFFDGETWRADKLAESLEFASTELLRHLKDVVLPLGLDLQTLDLVVGAPKSEGARMQA
jgi:hypothetical protein